MKLLLSGFEGSKRILHASSYLIQKYLGTGLDIEWLNYGAYKGQLDTGSYVKLFDRQESVQHWSDDLADHLQSIRDEFVILTLDDYLLSHPMDWTKYEDLYLRMMQNGDIVCARLCISDFYQPHEVERVLDEFSPASALPREPDGEIIQLSQNAEYSATLQYCIWRTDFLVEFLNRPEINTPWEFEVLGSRYLNSTDRKVIGYRPKPPLEYNCSSSLSSRWQGINVSGCNREDVEYLITAGALKRNELTNRGNRIHWGTPTAIQEAM